MSKIDNWLERLATLKQERKKATELLLKIEGQMEFIEKNAKDTLEQAIAVLMQLLVKQIRVSDSDTIFLFETLLTLLSEQQREIDMLKNITSSLTSEKVGISKKLEEMEKWRRKRERMLTEIDDIVKQRKEFFDQNR
jgi:hypothetical protein